MTKYIFKKLRDETNHYDKSDVTMELEAIQIDDIIEEFTYFLRASGFVVDEIVHIKQDEVNNVI